MKICQGCGQLVAEGVTICPACGGEVGEGRRFIDDYRILDVLHHGHASILCKAQKDGEEEPVMIRLFTPQSAVTDEVAYRLKQELEELKKLPDDVFVQHRQLTRSRDGVWYRVSEWVEAVNWGELISSGRLRDYRVAFPLMAKIARALGRLQRAGYIMPHLILNDIMAIEDEEGRLKVKIDYKLSRFLDPRLDRPSPMLKHLMECHPDIKNDRPLEFRSDIWSLGKVFLELLTADFESCDHLDQIDSLPLPEEVEVLLKTMLAEDQDLRPRYMDDVAEILEGISPETIEAASVRHEEEGTEPAREIKGLKRRQKLLGGLVAILILIGAGTWLYLGREQRLDATVLEKYANRYSPSVAFVLVDYWLKVDQELVYRRQAQGTAFLVDQAGYLLTNRHVAAPWLEDETLNFRLAQLRAMNVTPSFGFGTYLWFEGAKAFLRSAGMIEEADVADVFNLEAAFRSDGKPGLVIAGVAKPPVRTRQILASPLRDDFAVLKIDQVPQGLKPLPLARDLVAQEVPKLTRVIVLGFPLGSRLQDDTVNVSVTRGHVRRSFRNLLQVDASLYGGNSGGPVIDVRGRVIGIASGVATDRAPGGLPLVTPLWDLGMVLPITSAVKFLGEIKEGRTKWNGVLDPSVEAKLAKILAPAREGRWAEAMGLADEALAQSQDPSLVLAAGMLHFCAGDEKGARPLFERSLSLDDEINPSRLMLHLLAWRAGGAKESPSGEALLGLDWRSPAEFLGYLARVLEGLVPLGQALEAGENRTEQSWLGYVGGLIAEREKEPARAGELLAQAALKADPDDWSFFLARAAWDRIFEQREEAAGDQAQRNELQAGREAFETALARAVKEHAGLGAQTTPLLRMAAQDSVSLADKRRAYDRVLALEPDRRDVLAGLAFYAAAEGDFEEALTRVRQFLARPGRESAARLSLGLLEPQLLLHLDRREEARTALSGYLKLTAAPWYRALAECLDGRLTVAALEERTGSSPEHLLTGHTALGFWAEGEGRKEEARKHYRQALESFLDTRLEFDLARERLRRLRSEGSVSRLPAEGRMAAHGQRPDWKWRPGMRYDVSQLIPTKRGAMDAGQGSGRT